MNRSAFGRTSCRRGFIFIACIVVSVVWRWHIASVSVIDPAVAKTAFKDFEIIDKLTLDPLEIGQARAIGEFVQHPCRDQFRNVVDLRGFFAERAHGDLPE